MENLESVYAKRIAEEYAPKKTSKVRQLEKLDNKVKNPARVVSITDGILGSLILGAGMSFIMTDFGPSGNLAYILGIILGVVGLVIVGIAYPLYAKILKSRKEKYGFEINQLANEIMAEHQEN